MAKFQDRWFSLAPLGFPGWEHSEAFRSTTANSNTLHCKVREIGAAFEATLFDDGRGLFKMISAHVEGVEHLLDRRAA